MAITNKSLFYKATSRTDLTEWEKSFLTSIWKRLENGVVLSEKQKTCLERVAFPKSRVGGSISEEVFPAYDDFEHCDQGQF